MFAVREQQTIGTISMLKPQDLLVTLKILSFEVGDSPGKNSIPRFARMPWLIVDPISVYDRENDEIIVSDELEDFDAEDLKIIEQFTREQDPKEQRCNWNYRKLAQQLFMSLSEVSAAINRASKAGLLLKKSNTSVRVNKTILIEYIRYGAGVSFFAERGKVVRGIPTATSAPTFDDIFAISSQLPTVWPCARGTVKGVAINPIYKSVTKAVMIDPWLYKQMALLDIFRIGTAREKQEVLPLLTALKDKS